MHQSSSLYTLNISNITRQIYSIFKKKEKLEELEKNETSTQMWEIKEFLA